MDEKLLEQLRLAKEAGSKAMAKDFFAPTPGGDDEAAEGEAGAPAGDDSGGSVAIDAQADGLSPEQLEELLRMLGDNGGGGA